MNDLSQPESCDEIELKEIFLCLWKNKIMIILLTLLFSLIAFLFSKFILKPVFQTDIEIMIDIPKSINTKYGEYNFIMSTNEQYIDLIKSNTVLENTIKDVNIKDLRLDTLRKNISISKDDKKTNLFSINVKANNPKESYNIANFLYDNYIEFITLTINSACSKNYNIHFKDVLKQSQIELSRLSKTLENNIKLLDTIDKTYNIDEILNMDNSKLNSIILASPVNTNYTKIELDILNNKQKINSISNDITLYESYISELEKLIVDYNNKSIDNDLLLIQLDGTKIIKPSNTVVPTKKISPKNSINTIIGAILGCIIATLIAFIKTYWFENKKITQD